MKERRERKGKGRGRRTEKGRNVMIKMTREK